MKQFKLTFLVVALMMVLSNVGWGQTPFTATYTFGADGNVASFTYNGTTYSGISMGTIDKVGITTSSSTGNFRATTWPTASTLDVGKYIGFTISAQSGYKFTVNTITFGLGRSGTGTRTSQWRGNADSYAALINNYTTLSAGLTNTAGEIGNPDATTLYTGNVLTLGSSYADITTSVGFRYYMYAAESSAGTAGLAGPITITGTFTALSTPTITLSAPSQIGDGNVNQGATNVILSNFQAAVTTTNATLNGISFTTGGTYTASDMTNFKLWYNGTSNTYGSAVQLGSTIITSLGTGAHTFSSLTQAINNGSTGYFWITCDVSGSALAGNTINTAADPTLTFASGIPTGTISAGGSQTIQAITPDIALSSPDPAITSGNISQNTINNVVYRFDLAVTTANATLSGLQITTAGTFAATDLTNLKAWYSADATFSSGSDILLSTKATSLDAGTQVFPDWSNQVINSGSTGYIFITTDIPCGATTGHTINVNAILTSDITFISGNKTGTAFAGGTQTVITATPVNITVPTGTPDNMQMTLNWTAPSGCYDEIMIVAKANSSITGTPSGDGSSYTANLVFGTSGTQFGIKDGYVVYKGSTTGQTVTSLTNGTVYYFKFFTRKGNNWSSGIEINGIPMNYISGDFRTLKTGNWNATDVWETYNGATWSPIATSPTTTNNVTILAGHTITVEASGKNCNNLMVQGTLLAQDAPGSNVRYMNVFGDITCNGTIGHGTTVNGISFNIEGTSCTISGSGTFDAYRIRKNAATNATTNLTIAKDINLRYGGTALYNAASATTFNITINDGKTVNCTGDGTTLGSVAISGTNGLSTTTVGSITVNGILSVSSVLYLTSATTTNPVSFSIGSTGIVNAADINCDTSGSAGHIFTIDNGGKLNVTGAASSILSTFSFINNTYNLNSGSIVEYSYSTIQTVAPLTYSNLVISGGGTKNVVLGNVLVNDGLTLTSGLLNAGSYTITLGTSTSNLGTLSPSIPTSSSYVVGNFERWIPSSTTGDVYFPVGTSGAFRQAIINYTSAPTQGGKLMVSGNEGDPGTTNTNTTITEDGTNYVIDTYSKEAWWKFTNTGIQDGIYDITLLPDVINGVSATNFDRLRILKRTNNTSDWTLLGTHSPAGGSQQHALVKRTGLTGFSEFGIGGKISDGNSLSNAPLPVTLSSLNSTVIGKNNIKINWLTESETNNSGFEIERKAIDGSFAKIGFVSGHGTVNTPTNYSFEDRNLQTGKYKYRLKQIDNNGNFEYFALNGEVEIGVPKKFDLSQNYPNPFNPVTKINFDLPENGKVDLRLYDMLGREVATLVNEVRTAGYYTVSFNASSLSSGIYFYRMNAGKFSSIKKMAVIK